MSPNTHLFCNFKFASGSGKHVPCGAPAVVRHRQHPDRPWLGRCADHADALSPEVCTIEPYAGTRHLPAGDIEQLVADTENKWDECCETEHLHAEDALLDLLSRLRILAGIPIDEPQHPMTIGRTDRCLIETPHEVSFCGKREAHR